MKKRLLSLAMALCMVLSLLPASVFAEENAETPVCTCEEACTAETRNEECPVCGAEDAAVEDCCRYTAAVPETQAETVGTEEAGTEAAGTETDGESEAVQTGTEGTPETNQTETEGTLEMNQTETEGTLETNQTETDGAGIPACNCEGSCTAEAMDENCPVCGMDGAVPENCAAYVAPAAEEQIAEVVQLGAPAAEEPEPESDQTAVEKVQAMIDALPTVEELEDADDEKVDEVYAAVQDVCDALDELSTEELEQITGLDKLEALMEWFTGLVSTYGGEDYFNYTEANGKITITGLKDEYKNMTEVIIPASIGGVPVTAIGNSAFWDCKRLTSITIPSSVTTIEDGAFLDCTSLTRIDIPSGVTSIGKCAFLGCTSLTRIDIPSGVTSIEEGAFEDCTSLTSITIPKSVTDVYGYPFYNCSALKYVYYLGTQGDWDDITWHHGNPLDLSIVKFVGNIGQDVTFTPPSNLTYDGKAKEATVTKNNEDYGYFTKKYYDQNGQVYTAGPVDAGTYTVKIDIEASSKYSAISGYEVGRFTILQAENSFTTPLSIEDWTYGDTPKAPDAAAKFGMPAYSYSTEEDGIYTSEQPTNAGTYWVKAAVEETKNYTGLEDKIQFTILPKIYTITYVTGSNGSGNVTAGSKTHDVAFTLSSETFIRAGYEQTGWSTSDGGEKVYELGGTYTANENITLYPV